MQLETVDFKAIGPHGREGCIRCGYQELVQVLGLPVDGGQKVDAQWYRRDDRGRVLSIWNYKNGPKYGKALASITSWSCSGDKDLLKELFGDRYQSEQ